MPRSVDPVLRLDFRYTSLTSERTAPGLAPPQREVAIKLAERAHLRRNGSVKRMWLDVRLTLGRDSVHLARQGICAAFAAGFHGVLYYA